MVGDADSSVLHDCRCSGMRDSGRRHRHHRGRSPRCQDLGDSRCDATATIVGVAPGVGSLGDSGGRYCHQCGRSPGVCAIAGTTSSTEICEGVAGAVARAATATAACAVVGAITGHGSLERSLKHCGAVAECDLLGRLLGWSAGAVAGGALLHQ